MGDRYIFRVNANLKPSKLDALYVDLYEQFKNGFVLLPSFVEVITIPKDAEIFVEKEDEEV